MPISDFTSFHQYARKSVGVRMSYYRLNLDMSLIYSKGPFDVPFCLRIFRKLQLRVVHSYITTHATASS